MEPVYAILLIIAIPVGCTVLLLWYLSNRRKRIQAAAQKQWDDDSLTKNR